jgi:hypothetical protein
VAERSLTVTWNDPAKLAARAQSSSGLEFLQAIVAGELPPAPIQALLGFHLVEVEEGRVVFAGEPAEQHLPPRRTCGTATASCWPTARAPA